MTDHNQPTTPNQPKVTIDWERYREHLADWDVPDDVKREFIETMLAIVTGFVDLGFGLSPYQQSCGESTELFRVLEAMVVKSDTQVVSEFDTARAEPVSRKGNAA